MDVLMQAVSSGVGGDGLLKSWVSVSGPDWSGVGFPGPGTPSHIAISAAPAAGDGGGDPGDPGPSAALVYTFVSSTDTASDPGTGNFRLNNAALASVTAIAFDDVDANGGNNEAFLLAADDSGTLAHRGYVILRKLSAPSTFAIYSIVGTSTNSAGWVQLVVEIVSSNGSLTAADSCAVEFTRTGDPGMDGDPGDAGDAGPQGIVGLTYGFDASTSTSTDPGAGEFRLNHATPASVTAVAVNDSDANGNSVEAYLLAQDDSTSAVRAYILIRSRTTPSKFAIYSITAGATDSAGWVQYTVAHVANNGAFSAAEACDLQFSRTGDAAPIGLSNVITEATTARTLLLTDAEALVRCTNAAATAVTVPPNSGVAFSIGTSVMIRQAGAGQVTLVAGVGVTLNTSETLKTLKQHASVAITKVGTNEWDVTGERELAP